MGASISMARAKAKAKAKAKSSVRVNVNVNSKNRRVVSRKPFMTPMPQYLPPVRVEVHSSTPQQPVVVHQPPMMRDTSHPVGINITNNHTTGHPERANETITTTERVAEPNNLQSSGRLLRTAGQTAQRTLQGVGAVAGMAGFPATGAVLTGAGSLARAASTAGQAAETAGNIQQSGSQLLNGVRGLLTGQTAHDASERVGQAMDRRIVEGMTVPQLQEHLRSLGVTGWNTRTRRPDLLRMALGT